MHPLVLRLVATVNPTVLELLEMQYQFEEPFIVDSANIARLWATRTRRPSYSTSWARSPSSRDAVEATA